MKLSIVDFVHTIITKASEIGTSDIHMDPYQDFCTVRFRTDGLLKNICTIPPATYPEVVARVKILAGLRTDIYHAPQDGRFRHGLVCDVRVSILPSQHGESVVLRILNTKSGTSSLGDLGMSSLDETRVKDALRRHHGLVLITGPTGSGKTTTLYSIIGMLNDPQRSIVSLEDPIEYAIPGIRQVQVNIKQGITFATGLRAILRQDPNIIIVGEIRDNETAQIAIHSALTGHLVISTLHTNSACTAIPRLLDMGLEPYLVSATLSLVIGQRLLRKKNERGRVGVYETLIVTEPIKNSIDHYSSTENCAANILEKAILGGMHTMYEDGMEKVGRDIVVKEELMRILYEE